MPRYSLLLALPAGIALVGNTPDARACGGLFCQNQPVVQTGEGIVFFVDRTNATVEAIINIQYQGAAPDFAWVLPLQSAPLSVAVAPSFLFAAVDRVTAPQFNTTYETRGTCKQLPVQGVDAGGLVDSSVQDSGPGGGGVEVLFRGAVGPYDSAVIQSSNPQEVRTWLETNGYAVNDTMMEAVVPYVSQGDALLALKLLNGKTAGDIQPIWVTMQGNEVCVPIRLTAIAAIEDMDITTLVLSNEGRAIPENYFHVELDLPRIDWVSNGANYRQLVAEAADQGSGNAFVTEYSGTARVFDSQLTASGQYDRSPIANAARDASAVIFALQAQSLTIHPEVAAVLLDAIGEETLAERFITVDQFSRCPACFAGQLNQVVVDPIAIADAVWTRVVEPLADLQEDFDRYAYATRLYTLISPEEMMTDPDFAFRNDLPVVSNVHHATIVIDCSAGTELDDAPYEINIEETGQIVTLMRTNGVADDAYLDALPAAIKVQQLAEDRVIEDHTDMVASVLDQQRRMAQEQMEQIRNARARSCGCTSTDGSSYWGGLGMLILIGLSARTFARRRR